MAASLNRPLAARSRYPNSDEICADPMELARRGCGGGGDTSLLRIAGVGSGTGGPATDCRRGTLIAESAAVWQALPEQAWQEAFDSHPRIGEQKAQRCDCGIAAVVGEGAACGDLRG